MTYSLRWSRFALACYAALSFILVTTVNRAAFRLFPQSPWLPDSCLASFLICALLYFAIRPNRRLAMPRPETDWRRIRRVSLIWLGFWLLVSVAAALYAGHWVRYPLAQTIPQLIGFLAFGPLQEELLFRGAIFELAERSLTKSFARFPIFFSAALFGLHHLQLHGFALSPAALLQVAFTFPMGIVFGLLRVESQSLWPGWLLHLLTNLPGAIGS